MILRSAAVSSTSRAARPPGRPAADGGPAGSAADSAGGAFPGDLVDPTGRTDGPGVATTAGAAEAAAEPRGAPDIPAGALKGPAGIAGSLAAPACGALAGGGCCRPSCWPLPGAALCDEPGRDAPGAEPA